MPRQKELCNANHKMIRSLETHEERKNAYTTQINHTNTFEKIAEGKQFGIVQRTIFGYFIHVSHCFGTKIKIKNKNRCGEENQVVGNFIYLCMMIYIPVCDSPMIPHYRD